MLEKKLQKGKNKRLAQFEKFDVIKKCNEKVSMKMILIGIKRC